MNYEHFKGTDESEFTRATFEHYKSASGKEGKNLGCLNFVSVSQRWAAPDPGGMPLL
jgi:hypothetical protein